MCGLTNTYISSNNRLPENIQLSQIKVTLGEIVIVKWLSYAEQQCHNTIIKKLMQLLNQLVLRNLVSHLV